MSAWGSEGRVGGKEGRGRVGRSAKGTGRQTPGTHPPEKEEEGGQAPSQRGGRGLCRGFGGQMGLRGGEPLTLQVVSSNELEDFVEPNDW